MDEDQRILKDMIEFWKFNVRGLLTGSVEQIKRNAYHYEIIKKMLGITALETYKSQLRAFDSFETLNIKVDKITENIKNGGINYVAIGKFDTRIEQLEKKVEGLSEYNENHSKDTTRFYKNNRKKISELKELIQANRELTLKLHDSKTSNNGIGNRVNQHSTPEKGAIPPTFNIPYCYQDKCVDNYETPESLKFIKEFDFNKKEGEKTSTPIQGHDLESRKPRLGDDSKPSCEHRWTFQDPEGLGHSMAFCKKCGYLRDSKPSELRMGGQYWMQELKEKPSEPTDNTCFNCFYSNLSHNCNPCNRCRIHDLWSSKLLKEEEDEFEYGLTEKGLDAVDRIIKESPQYVQLVYDIVYDLEDIPTSDDEDTEDVLTDLCDKWNKILDDITRTKE